MAIDKADDMRTAAVWGENSAAEEFQEEAVDEDSFESGYWCFPKAQVFPKLSRATSDSPTTTNIISRKMKAPLLILKEIPGSDTPANPKTYGYDTIRIWQFNYDGQGTALVSYDNNNELESLSGDDLHLILCGDPGNGHRWYQPVNLCVDDQSPAVVS